MALVEPKEPVNQVRAADAAAAFWGKSEQAILTDLGTSRQGLSQDEVQRRLQACADSRLKPQGRSGPWRILLSQFTSPIVLMLLAAAGLSLFLSDTADAAIILFIVLISAVLGFWQEHGAARAVEQLMAVVEVKSRVLRGGQPVDIPVNQVVPGDVVCLKAGAVIPADCYLLEGKDLFADEATLTGETYPQEKIPGALSADTSLAQRHNMLFMGTHVISGTGTAIAVQIGKATEFGKVSDRLRIRPPATHFETGIRQFGYLLAEVTGVMLILIFAFNVYFHRPVLESLLFALALAVGVTPQLLPVIITVNLAHGARRMAEKRVITRRLASIENFGSMNVLCSDKTGTLTEGVVHVDSALDPQGAKSEKVLLYAYVNASYETGFDNPIDQAIRQHQAFDLAGWQKLDEIPYDFLRKRLSILAGKDGHGVLITKGALQQVLQVCSRAEQADGTVVPLASIRDQLDKQYADLSDRGLRTLGVACKDLGAETHLRHEEEADMTFLGIVALADPPKAGVAETIRQLLQLGVRLRIITGDNAPVARRVSQQVGLNDAAVLTGPQMRQLSDEALMRRAGDVDVFAEVEPNQKERIILALKKAGNVVGYMGDGINDASALHAADVGISVDSAADVAKEAADFVLLDKDLGVLVDGIVEGRRTFANTLKYIFMATSANFGNMFSMAGASLMLPFLPLLPKQILLTNVLTDLPEMTIAGDNVDPEMVDTPRRWDMQFIRRFMLTFGILSSVFDYLTFGVLLLLLHANPAQFRTGWFLESVVSAALIVLVVRSRRPFLRSRPSKKLLLATLLVVVATVLLPYMPLAAMLGFVPLPGVFLIAMAVIVGMYILAAEMTKAAFYRRA